MAQSQSGARLDVAFPFDGDEGVRDALRNLMAALEARFQVVEELQEDAATQADTLVNVGLARINDVLLPSVLRIQKLTSLGFLLARSTTSVKLELAEKTFIITEGEQRDLFTPSSYVAIERESDYTSRAVAKVLAYDNKLGFLKLSILAVFGPAGPFTDWVISASPGVTEATRANMAKAEDAAYRARLAREAADADVIQTGADRAQTGSDRAASGASAASAAASAVAAQIGNVVSFGAAQNINSAGMVTAKKNIGALGTGFTYFGASQSLTAAFMGQTALVNTGITLNLPPISSVSEGHMIVLAAWNGTATIGTNGSGTNIYHANQALSTLNLRIGQSVLLVAGGGQWNAYMYATPQGDAPSFNEVQTKTVAQKAIARLNMGINIGRRYYTGNGGVANVTAADIGGLVYLESDITVCNMLAVAGRADGDEIELYCRGTVRFNAAAGDPFAFGMGNANFSFIDMKPGDRLKLTLGADAWDVVSYTTTHNKALMVDRALTFSDAEKQQLYANADIAIPHGQCRLDIVSETTIALVTCFGNKIFINGNYRTIPAAGVSTSNAGLSANTLYYVFAYWDVGSSSIKLAIGIGAPTTDPLYGHKVVGGQGSDAANRVFTLVGMVYTTAAGKFQNDNNARMVASWFNRRPVSFAGAVTLGGGSGSGQWVPLGNNYISLIWADQRMSLSSTCTMSGNAAGAQARSSFAMDGNLLGADVGWTGYANSALGNANPSWKGYLSEGIHAFSMYGNVNGGGATYYVYMFGETML